MTEKAPLNDKASADRGVSPWAHAFLVLILGFLSYCVFLLVRYGPTRSFNWYSSLAVPLTMLFNHIAFQYTKRGWKSKVMKGFAAAWAARSDASKICSSNARRVCFSGLTVGPLPNTGGQLGRQAGPRRIRHVTFRRVSVRSA